MTDKLKIIYLGKCSFSLRRFRSYDRMVLIIGKPHGKWSVVKYERYHDRKCVNKVKGGHSSLSNAYKYARETYPEHFTNLIEMMYK